MNNERCTWVSSPVTGLHYGSCGAEVGWKTLDGEERLRVSPENGYSEKPDEMELCPGCGKLVEHATWEEVEEVGIIDRANDSTYMSRMMAHEEYKKMMTNADTYAQYKQFKQLLELGIPSG